MKGYALLLAATALVSAAVPPRPDKSDSLINAAEQEIRKIRKNGADKIDAVKNKADTESVPDIKNKDKDKNNTADENRSDTAVSNGYSGSAITDSVRPPADIAAAEKPASGADTSSNEINTTHDQAAKAQQAHEFGPLIMVDAEIPDYVPNEILYFSGLPDADLKRAANAANVKIIAIETLDQVNLSMVTAKLKAADSVPAALARIAQQPGIGWAQPNHYFQLLGNSRSKGYSLHGIRQNQGQDISGRIVMIDSAVDIGNPALANAKIKQRLFGISGNPGAHGTAIAELLVGTGDFAGVAKGAQLYSFAAFEPETAKTALSQSRYLAKALNEASRLRPDVANLSFGAKATDRILAHLLNKMEERGICVVSAAGNGNGGPVLFPGRHRTTLSVTALDAAKHVYTYASKGPEIDTAAWGVNMNAAVPGGRRSVSGTSFATAVVSGSLLRMPYCNGGRTPSAMRKRVTENAQDLGAPGHDDIFGAGLFRLQADQNEAGSAKSVAENPDSVVSQWPIYAAIFALLAIISGLIFMFVLRRRKK